MSSSGLREVLGTIMEVIQFHTCSQVQPSRAFQGDLVVSVVLCATIISVYECSLQEESKKDLFSNK